MLRRSGLVAMAMVAGAPVQAASIDSVYDAMRLPELVVVMQAEGGRMAETLATEYLGGEGGSGWTVLMDRIYDTDRMDGLMRAGFREEMEALPPEELDRLETFFTTDPGEEIVRLEIEGREAFLDPEVEAAAEQTAEHLEFEQPQRYAALSAYIAENDLVELNVSGALNANLHFYQGLVEGGAFEMDESDMVREVWAQEEETRTESLSWLVAYLTFAYAPLEVEDIEAYTALSRTDAGKTLNRALFNGFETLYNQTYHDLGLAVSFQMTGQDL